MEHKKLNQMIKGWFVGGFEPSAFSTSECEVGIKQYRAGDSEEAHYHKVATEITVILNGKARMLDQVWEDGDIITLSPGELTDFKAITDVVTVVVKVPSVQGDKYLLED
jgi:hypothetical protein